MELLHSCADFSTVMLWFSHAWTRSNKTVVCRAAWCIESTTTLNRWGGVLNLNMRIIALQWRVVKSTLEECKTHIDMQHTNHRRTQGHLLHSYCHCQGHFTC